MLLVVSGVFEPKIFAHACVMCLCSWSQFGIDVLRSAGNYEWKSWYHMYEVFFFYIQYLCQEWKTLMAIIIKGTLRRKTSIHGCKRNTGWFVGKALHEAVHPIGASIIDLCSSDTYVLSSCSSTKHFTNWFAIKTKPQNKDHENTRQILNNSRKTSSSLKGSEPPSLPHMVPQLNLYQIK